MSIFPRKKPDELHELRRKVDTLEAVNRAQNVKIGLLEDELDRTVKRLDSLEDVVRRVLAPEVKA